MYIKENMTVLFQGDSITDDHRNREVRLDLGRGYVPMVAGLLEARYPEKNLTYLNRGAAGDRVRNLKERWQEDCLDLKPDIVSILIGINDCWKRYKTGEITTAESYYNDYRHILTQLKENGNPQIVLCEPFLLPVPEDRRRWREDLDPKIDAVRALAREFHTYLVPLDGMLNAAAAVSPPEFWAADGVHPTTAGNTLIAREWLRATGLQY